MVRASIAAALAVLALTAAPAAAQARTPEGFFGVMWDRAVTEGPDADQDAQWALMKASGVESVRTVFRWSTLEPAPGQFDFAASDRVVSLAARHDVKVLPILQYAPGWAALVPGEEGSPPRHVSDYTSFLRALVSRYGPAGSFWAEHPELPLRPLREWQIWNEPHLGWFWSTEGRAPGAWAREYARLLRASERAIEQLDPGATIVLAGLADYAWRHLARLYRHRIRGHFDVATFNLFTSRPRKVIKGMRLFRGALRRAGERRKPIWLTETTWPAAKERVPVPQAAWQRAWYTTDEGMAARVRGLYTVAARNRRRMRLGRVYWYTWASAYSDSDLFDYSGLVRYGDGAFEARPALAAYAASARRLGRR